MIASILKKDLLQRAMHVLINWRGAIIDGLMKLSNGALVCSLYPLIEPVIGRKRFSCKTQKCIKAAVEVGENLNYRACIQNSSSIVQIFYVFFWPWGAQSLNSQNVPLTMPLSYFFEFKWAYTYIVQFKISCLIQ